MKNRNYYSILGLYDDNGKDMDNYFRMLGLYKDDGKEHGTYFGILGLYRDNEKTEFILVYWGCIGIGTL